MNRSREIQTLLWAMAAALALLALLTWWLGQRERGGSGVVESNPAIYVELDRGSEGTVVYRLPAGAAVRDLFRAAGLPLPERLDPSRTLESGRRYRLEGEGGISESWMSGERLVALGIPIPLNECSLQDLVAVPGIGQATALRILERREARGRIDSYRELVDLPGVGPKTVEVLTRHTRL